MLKLDDDVHAVNSSLLTSIFKYKLGSLGGNQSSIASGDILEIELYKQRVQVVQSCIMHSYKR